MDYKQKAQEIRGARRALYEEAGSPSWHELYRLDQFMLHYPTSMTEVWCGNRDPSEKTQGILCQMAAAAILDRTPPPYVSREFWKLLRELDDV